MSSDDRSEPPKTFRSFIERFPQIGVAWEQLGAAGGAGAAGPQGAEAGQVGNRDRRQGGGRGSFCGAKGPRCGCESR